MTTFSARPIRALLIGALVLCSVAQALAVSATVTLGSLTQTYDGAPKRATATTNPAGLNVTFAYNGSGVPPTAPGTYVVVATISDATYSGQASSSFTISKATATVTLDTASLAATYDNTAKSTVVSTQPLGLTVNLTYDGSSTAPTAAGSYAVVATVNDTNYSGTASGTLVINKANAVITYGALPTTFFGDASFAASATASSGATVTFSVPSGTSTVTGNTINVVDGTAFTLRASAAATANYNAPPDSDLVLTAGLTNQTITFGALGNKTVGDAAFAPSATASSGLTLTFAVQSGPATLSSGMVTVTGAGVVTIRANQGGDTSNNPAVPVYQSFTVAKKPQTITFGSLANKTYGDAPFTLSATSSESLPVSFSVVSGPATLSGSTLTLQGAGTVTVRAWQLGDATRAAAATVDQSFVVAKKTISVTAADATRIVGQSNPNFTLNYSGLVGSDVASEFATQPTATTTATTASAVGTYPITPSGGSSANYNFNFTAGTLTVNPLTSQTITFAALANKTYGDAAFALTATASSGLSVGFRVVSGPASYNGSVVSILGPGTVVIEASQSGNSTYAAAPAVQQSFTVAQAAQTITFGALAGKTFADAPFALSATASSGLPVSFSVVSGPATISGSTVTLTGAGTVVIAADQSGNTNYAAASTVQQSFSVGKTNQTITFAALAGKTFGDAPFALSATASSGLPVSFSVVSGPATISGSTVTLTGAGTVVIAADQSGNTNYAAASTVQQSFSVGKTNQTITFAALPDRNLSDGSFTVSATASSGLPVTFIVQSGPATISGNTVTPTAAGTVLVVANQSGNASYAAAPSVGRTFAVNPSSQTITFGALNAKTYGDAAFALNATASSGLAVTYRVVSGPATISGSTVTLTGAGTVVIAAEQAGNSLYDVAPSVQQSFTVAKASQTITTFTLTPQFSGNPAAGSAYRLSGVSSSGLLVSFSVVSGSASVSGSLLTLSGLTSSLRVRASQAGDANYLAATPVDRDIDLTFAPQIDGLVATVNGSPVSGNLVVAPGVTITLRLAGQFDSATTFSWSGPKGLIAGATTDTLVLKNISLADAGGYAVAVHSAKGNATIGKGIAVYGPPKIVQQPSAFSFYLQPQPGPPTLTFDDLAALNGAVGKKGLGIVVDTAGLGGATFVWRKNGVPINFSKDLAKQSVSQPDPAASRLPGLVDGTLEFDALRLHASDNPLALQAAYYTPQQMSAALRQESFVYGVYDVVVSTPGGSVTSAAVPVMIYPEGSYIPHFTTNPKSQKLSPGATLTLTASVRNDGLIHDTRWWYWPPDAKNPGAYYDQSASRFPGERHAVDDTTFTLTVPNVYHTSNAGYYSLGVRVIYPTTGLLSDEYFSNTAQVQIPLISYAGYYSGRFADGRPWSLFLDAANNGVLTMATKGFPFFALLPASVTEQGKLIVTGANQISISLRQNAVAARTLDGGTRGSPTATAAPDFSTFTGTFGDGGTLSIGLPGTSDLDSTTTRADGSGDMRAYSGFYEASTSGSSTQTFISVSPTGEAIVFSPATNDYGVGTVDASGKLTIATAGQQTVTGNISASTSVLTADLTSTSGTTTSLAAVPQGSDVAGSQRLSNLSSRAQVGTGAQVAIAGFVIGGVDPKTVLIRAVGPTLSSLGITKPLAAPKLEVRANDGSIVAANTDWRTSASADAVAAAGDSVGAFKLGANSADSALLLTLDPGTYTAIVSDTANQGGVGLVEVYDLSPRTPGQNLLNNSLRGLAGGGEATMISGLTIDGTAPKRVLIRAAGPALAAFGLTGTLAQPQLKVFAGDKVIAQTTGGWSASPDVGAITQAIAATGAFPFPNGSADAAMIVNLAPGSYTLHVTGPNGTTGVALLEFYDVP